MGLIVHFEYNKIYDFRKLVYTLHNVKTGFFQKNGFLVTEIFSKVPASVVIPNYPLIRKKEFWKEFSRLKNLQLDYIKLHPIKLSKLYELVEKEKPIDPRFYEELWKTKEKDFTKILKNFLLVKNNLNVSVYLTHHGSISSYINNKNKLTILLRHDANISQIAFCILSYLFTQNIGNVEDKYIKTHNWTDKQNIVEYLMKHSSINSLFPKYQSVLEYIKIGKIPSKLIENSNKLYQELGFPLTIDLNYKENTFYLNGKIIDTLTKNEIEVLKVLIDNKNKIVTYDQLAEAIWKEDSYNFYSLEAISKTVERVNNKIKACNIFEGPIKLKRGLGYEIIN